MSKKESSNGKGDRNRVSDKRKYDENWEKIFGNNIMNSMNPWSSRVIWFTGQPGAGKTTLAKELIRKLSNEKVIHIDGDDLRDVLDNKDYSERGRRILRPLSE